MIIAYPYLAPFIVISSLDKSDDSLPAPVPIIPCIPSTNNILNLTNSVLTIKNYTQDALEWDGGVTNYKFIVTNSSFRAEGNRAGITGTFTAEFNNAKIIQAKDILVKDKEGNIKPKNIIRDYEIIKSTEIILK